MIERANGRMEADWSDMGGEGVLGAIKYREERV
jgi:hypothetical protein